MNKDKTKVAKSENKALGHKLGDMLGTKPHLEIEGNNKVILEGSRGVVLYSQTEIRVNMGDFTLGILGRGLNLKCISPTKLIIEGFFENIEFCV